MNVAHWIALGGGSVWLLVWGGFASAASILLVRESGVRRLALLPLLKFAAQIGVGAYVILASLGHANLESAIAFIALVVIARVLDSWLSRRWAQWIPEPNHQAGPRASPSPL